MEEQGAIRMNEDQAGEQASCVKPLRSPDSRAHFYMEGGYVVFTEAYHAERGYCCKSGCRHCPFGFKRKR